jgi:hypothetical protein
MEEGQQINTQVRNTGFKPTQKRAFVGVGLIIAMANLFFRDVKYIVDGVLTVGIFATAVYYPLHGYFILNPLLL